MNHARYYESFYETFKSILTIHDSGKELFHAVMIMPEDEKCGGAEAMEVK